MAELVHRSCPSCAADNSAAPATAFGDEQWPIKACAVCGFVYLELAPVYERLVEEFAWEKTYSAETRRRVGAEPIRQFVSRQLKVVRRRWLKRDKLAVLVRRCVPAGNVLDVGCGGGDALAALSARHVPHGIEISRALALQADARVQPRGGRVVQDAALSGMSAFPADYFAGVLLSSFLEHEIEPRALLGEVCRTLAPDGRCIVKVPNYASWNRVLRGRKWCGFRLPDHVNYFTPASLLQMCRGAGFAVVQFGLADRLPTSDSMWIVLARAARQRPVAGDAG